MLIINQKTKTKMCATTLATEEIKKDIQELIKVAVEGERDPITRIADLCDIVEERDDYVSFIKDSYVRKIGFSDIIGQSLISKKFVDMIISFFSKYEKRELMILLDSTGILLYDRPSRKLELKIDN
jgi:ribonucleotide reductase beta subunit family protein with ferritin-like domain